VRAVTTRRQGRLGASADERERTVAPPTAGPIQPVVPVAIPVVPDELGGPDGGVADCRSEWEVPGLTDLKPEWSAEWLSELQKADPNIA